MKEPSVLDLIKEKMTFWQKKPEGSISGSKFIEPLKNEPDDQHPTKKNTAKNRHAEIRLGPWKILTALILAVISQLLLEPPDRSINAAISLYALSAFLIIASLLTHEWDFPVVEEKKPGTLPMTFKRIPFYLSLPFLMLAFFAFGGNRFTIINLT